MKNKVILKNMMFYGFHGVHEFERELGQRFYVDVEFFADLEEAQRTDDLQYAVDYTTIYSYVKEVVENHRFQLLEALGAHIADALMSKPRIQSVTVRIRKPNVPIPGPLDYVEVEVTR